MQSHIVHEETLYPINICKCTGWLTILCSKNPAFCLYFIIQFQLPHTEQGIPSLLLETDVKFYPYLKYTLQETARHRYNL